MPESFMMFLVLVGTAAALFLVILLFLYARRRDLHLECERLGAGNQALRKQTEDQSKTLEELRRGQGWLQSVFNNVGEMAFVYGVTEDNLPDRFAMVNDLACTTLKYSREALLRMTPLDTEAVEKPFVMPGYSRSDLVVLPDEYIYEREKRIATRDARHLMGRVLTKGPVHYESVFQDSEGKEIQVEVDVRRVDFGDRPMVIATARNITERLEAAHTLDESKRRFQTFMMHSPIGIALYDGDKHLVGVNHACLEMFGIPDGEQFAKFDLFNNPFMPADVGKKLAKGESVRYEAVVDFREVLEKSLFVTARTGEAHLDILIDNMGLDKDFASRGYCIEVQDLTPQRRAEADLRETERQLRQAEKMEAVGSMAAGIAHDFNNILTPILGCARMLMRTPPKNEEVHDLAGRIMKAGNRAKELIGQILTFSHRPGEEDVKSLRPIHVTPIAKEVLALQRLALPEKIDITRNLKADQDIVLADPTRIHQVLMNLCKNAGYAMRDTSGTLELSLTNFVMDKRMSGRLPQHEPYRYLRISVKDTGTGMDEETAERVLEPFFTTKARGEGSGMGLSVVHGIVQSLKGSIQTETELGKGSVFHVDLPVLEEEAHEESEREDAELPGGNERVLVVDDDADAADTLADMLRSLGYESVTAGSGSSALRLFRMDPNYFDVVLTDYVMPGMSGLELAEEIRAIRPGFAIMLCSGLGEKLPPERLEHVSAKEVLRKPVAMEELATMIRRVLDGGSG